MAIAWIRNIIGRKMVIMMFLCFSVPAFGQNISAQLAIKNYTPAQKRLLLLSTAQFIDFLTQETIDQDSIRNMASRVVGLPISILYQKLPKESHFINASDVGPLTRSLKTQKGQHKEILLFELAFWYLHQPGNLRAYLDSADVYIKDCIKEADLDSDNNLRKSSLDLLGEYYYRVGNANEGKRALLKLAGAYQHDKDTAMMADVWIHLSQLIPMNDPSKLFWLKKSFEQFKILGLPEKQMEAMGAMVNYYHHQFNLKEMNKLLFQISALQQATNFKHSLYTQYLLSFVLVQQSDYVKGLNYAYLALHNMNWSGNTAMAGTFFRRIGASYEALGKKEIALSWYKKAIETRNREDHIYWYKSLFYAAILMTEMNRPREAITLVENISRQYPPADLWEKIQLLAIVGDAYDQLKEPKLADLNYTSILRLSERYPKLSNYPDFGNFYLKIGNFYARNGDAKKAKLFMSKASSVFQNPTTQVQKYYLLFRIDSTQGNYQSAMQNHIKYKFYYDSLTRADQRRKLDEITVADSVTQKDKDIKLLKQEKASQKLQLKQNELIRNIMIAGGSLLIIILVLLFNQFRLKNRTNKAINKKNDALLYLLKEKEWLLKEVHHRVKNNLHTVICLLESQAAYLENDALKAIENSQHRIYAMSLIHQKLYQSADIKTVDMSVFLPEFIRYLSESFQTNSHIQFELHIDPLKLGVSYAVPLSLIINEAVTNAIKYAFPGNRKGIVTITLREFDEQVLMNIRDNGIGIDVKHINTQSASLGLKLLKGLAEDIKADLRIENNHGTSITLAFKIEELMHGMINYQVEE